MRRMKPIFAAILAANILEISPDSPVRREDRDGKARFFTKQKSVGVAGTTFKLFCEVKSLGFTSNPAIQLKILG